MKELKQPSRLAIRTPVTSVSLQIRDYQVTLKVKSPVPQKTRNASSSRLAIR